MLGVCPGDGIAPCRAESLSAYHTGKMPPHTCGDKTNGSFGSIGRPWRNFVMGLAVLRGCDSGNDLVPSGSFRDNG